MARQKLMPKQVSAPMGAYSQGVSTAVDGARMVFTSGQLPLKPDGELVSTDVGEQTRCVFERIKAVLAEAGASLEDIAKVTIFVTDMSDFSAVSAVRNEYFAGIEAASSILEVPALAKPGCKVEIEAVAVVGH
jgi:2-iminobutanoate/2-iminopropanoate deaminase